MSHGRPDLSRLTDHIRVNVWRQFRLDDLASTEGYSRDTVQRVFRGEGTTFTRVQRRVRAEVAVEGMQSGKLRTARDVASRLHLSESQVYRIFRDEYGLCTQDLLRACRLHRHVLRLRMIPEPSAGTWRYQRRRQRWRKIDRELLDLFEPLGAEHPLAEWAHSVLADARRPDFRKPTERFLETKLRAQVERRLKELSADPSRTAG